MKQLKNTLYITNPDSYLTRDGQNLVIKNNGEEVFRRPIHLFENIVCFAYMGASPALLALCSEAGVFLSFHNQYGKFLAAVHGPQCGNVLLRRQQYRLADNEEACLALARNFITGKLVNCRSVLKRCMRDYREQVDYYLLEDCVERLNISLSLLSGADSLEALRGIEGEAAKTYFSGLNEAILQQKDSFYMHNRSRRPPLDNFNAMLSFLYSLLAQQCAAALQSVGLDPFVGFLHRDRPGRASLALDLMEEFRPFLVDRLTVTMINRKQISAADFLEKEGGGIIMTDEGRKTILTAWQKRKEDQVTHSYLNEKMAIGLLPFAGAMLLARCLRGDLQQYPPFFSS
ncbi:MAG: type I-C CRISPR-associated endonuclease Cas1c [Clostridia bacterium]|nr:type I-C CRISPR-associated endonuclease Cas1c [Clostridia bacterium]